MFSKKQEQEKPVEQAKKQSSSKGGLLLSALFGGAIGASIYEAVTRKATNEDESLKQKTPK